MKTQNIEMLYRKRSVWLLFTTLVFAFGLTLPAFATWRTNDAQNAWSGFNNAFLYTGAAGYDWDFALEQGGTDQEGFWTEAEMIDMANDAYAENRTTNNQDEVEDLCDGFVALHGDNWSSDTYNDDMTVAVIAFIRSYKTTGTARWLNDAETNFDIVWNRGHDSTFGGGIWETTGEADKNSSVNWPFVIAGNLINEYNGGTGNYLSEAETNYAWVTSTLYSATGSTNGEVADAIDVNGTHWGQYSYNYGFAIGAASERGDRDTLTNAAMYLMNNIYGGTVGGVNILPNYGQGGNDGGYNGIVMRWIGVANGHGNIPSNVMTWAQANINQAWAERNGSTTLSWDDWFTNTPATGTYSWDDSSTLSGMLDLPPTSP
jgi:hypothetical protein